MYRNEGLHRTLFLTLLILVGFVFTQTAMSEDGAYMLEKARGLHRVGNTPAKNAASSLESVVDFDVSEDGRSIYLLDDSGQIISDRADGMLRGLDVNPARARRMAISRKGYAILDENGLVHFGDGQDNLGWNVFFGWDIARDIELSAEGDGVVVLDGMGGLHIRGELPRVEAPFFGWDIARDVEISQDGEGYYILDGFGLIHPVGDIPIFTGLNLGWDIARDLEISQSGQGYYILDGFGGLHTGGDAIPFALPYFGWDVATDLEIAMQATGEFRGTVFGETASGELTPIRNAKVRLVKNDLPEDSVLPELSFPGSTKRDTSLKTRTNSAGEFVLTGLPAGSFTVEIQAYRHRLFESEVEVPAGAQIIQEYVLLADSSVPDETDPSVNYGKVEGSVAEDVGMLDVYIPIPNARVSIYISNRRVLTTRTNEDGQYSFPHVPVGEFKMKVSARDFYPAEDSVEVVAGETTYKSFQLLPEPVETGRVYGRVWTAGEVDCTTAASITDCTPIAIPVPGALVHLVPLDEPIYRDFEEGSNILPESDDIGWHTETDENGHYEFNEIPLGRYALIVRAEGFLPFRRVFVLGNCHPVRLDVPAGAPETNSLAHEVSPIGPGEFEPGIERAIHHAADKTALLVDSSTGVPSILDEIEQVRAELQEAFAEAGCHIGGIVGGGFFDINHLITGQVYSGDGSLQGIMKGEYVPLTETGGSFFGKVIAVASNRRFVFEGDYDDNQGWGFFHGDWNEISSSSDSAANGRLFGLWRRVSNEGGYFIGLWTICHEPCTEKEINVELIPVPETGSIYGNVSGITPDATGSSITQPIPGALVSAIPQFPVPYMESDGNRFCYNNGEAKSTNDGAECPWTPFVVPTDENGDYRFEQLPAGPYKLVVTARGWYSQTREVELPPNGELEENFILEPIVPKTGRVKGTVSGMEIGDVTSTTEPSLVPLEGALVVLIPEPRLEPADGAMPVEDAVLDETGDVPEMIADMEVTRRYRTTTTAADGSYSFEDVPVGHYRMVAKARGYYPQHQSADVFEDQTTEVNFTLRPVPPPAFGSLIGHVTDTLTGEPVVRAVVTAWPINVHPIEQPAVANGAKIRDENPDYLRPDVVMPRPFRTTTNEEGYYFFKRLPVGFYRVTVRAMNYHPAKAHAGLHKDEVTTLNFALRPVPPTGSVVGQVTEANSAGIPGDPIPEALVTMIPWDIALAEDAETGIQSDKHDPAGQIFRTRTNREGYYQFPEVPAGIYMIRVYKEGYHRAHSRVEVHPGETSRRDFQLRPIHTPPIGTVVGTVYSMEDGGEPEPIHGAFVGMFPWRPELLGSDGLPPADSALYFTRTDRQGEYEFEEVPEGIYLILAVAQGHEPDYRKIEVLEDEITQANFFLYPLIHPEEGMIHGRVFEAPADNSTGDDAEPIPHVKLMLFEWPDWLVTIPEYELIDPSELPIPPLRVTWSNERGYYEFGDLDEGRYVVFARKHGYIQAAQMVYLPMGGEVKLNFFLNPTGTNEMAVIFGHVEGIVPNSDGTHHKIPLGGAKVSAFPVGEDGILDENDPEQTAGLVTYTNNLGQYKFPPLHPGLWIVKAEKAGYELQRQEVFAQEGEETEASFLLHPVIPEEFGHVSGMVFGIDGDATDATIAPGPLAGAKVAAYRLNPSGMDLSDSNEDPNYPGQNATPYITHTDSTGHYELPPLPVGAWLIRAAKEGYHSSEDIVRVEAGDHVELNFYLDVMNDPTLPGKLLGQVLTEPEENSVTDEAHIPLAGAVVVLSPHSYETFAPIETRTDRHGEFRFHHLVPDTYGITISREGFEDVVDEIEIPAGEVVEETWFMEPASMFEEIGQR